MNRSLVSIASFCGHGKDLLAPRLKNADKLLLQEFDSLRAAKSAYQPVRYHFGKIFHDVFAIWMHKHYSKNRPPFSLNHPGFSSWAKFSVKHHNLKMAAQLEFLDLSGHGNLGSSIGKLCTESPLMYVIDQRKIKLVRSVVTVMDTVKGKKAKFLRLSIDWLRNLSIVPKRVEDLY